MTRWFYTDPLAAAWMARHFGMRFRGDDYTLTFGPTGLVQYVPDLFVIHPDSLDLLKPRPGDVLRDPQARGNPQLVLDPGNHGWSISQAFATVLGGGNIIIQRRGIPFMWPDREAA